MSKTARPDGRKATEARKMSAKVGIIKNADGSAMFQIGKTTAYAAVYGPRDLHPKFMQDPATGILRVNYNMMPFSGHGNRVRPGASRRSKEICIVIKNALLPVLDLKQFPNSVVDVFIELPQTDAGTRCAGICAASMALADAGITMGDMVAAVSMGILNDEVLYDINGHEDCDLGATDIPIALIPRMDKIALLQLDGEATREQIKEALEKGKEVCKKIVQIQKDALRAKFIEA